VANNPPEDYTRLVMLALKARVENGRFVIDEPADLPEGEEFYLMRVDDSAEFSDEERARLESALERSFAQAHAGQFVEANQVVSRLLSRS